MEDLYIGIEIGATKQQIAVGNDKGELLHVLNEKIPTPDGAADILDWMEKKVSGVISAEENFRGTIRAIGIGFGGIVRSATGEAVKSIQVSGWNDFPIGRWIQSKFNKPAVVVNDTVAGGYGELNRGSGKDSKHFFYSNIGSGIGGALFLDRKYYDGLGYGAAYLGHTYIPDWTDSSPGAGNKLENICSGFAVEKRLRKTGYVPEGSYLMELCDGDISRLSCTELYNAASAGDDFSVSEINRVARFYSLGLSNLITLFSPDTVSIGGGLSHMGDLLLNPIRKYTDELVFVSCKKMYKIVQCRFIEEAVLIGAVLFARDFFKGSK